LVLRSSLLLHGVFLRDVSLCVQCVPYSLAWGRAIVAAGNDKCVSFYDIDGNLERTFDYSAERDVRVGCASASASFRRLLSVRALLAVSARREIRRVCCQRPPPCMSDSRRPSVGSTALDDWVPCRCVAAGEGVWLRCDESVWPCRRRRQLQPLLRVRVQLAERRVGGDELARDPEPVHSDGGGVAARRQSRRRRLAVRRL
jgi:hypothetical protein